MGIGQPPARRAYAPEGAHSAERKKLERVVRGTGLWILDARCWIPVAGLWLLITVYLLRVAGCGVFEHSAMGIAYRNSLTVLLLSMLHLSIFDHALCLLPLRIF